MACAVSTLGALLGLERVLFDDDRLMAVVPLVAPTVCVMLHWRDAVCTLDYFIAGDSGISYSKRM